MAPNKWDEEESDSTPPTSPPAPVVRRSKFDDEEDESDVIESWDAAEDSEVEREKAKKAAEAKAKAEAEAKAKHKSKAQRIEEHRQANLRRRQMEEEEESSEEEEDEGERRARLRQQEKDSDLAHAEDLFGGLGVADNKTRRTAAKPVTLADPADPANTIDLAALPIFNPQTKDQFAKLRETLVPLLSGNAKKAHYALFMQEFTKQICKDMASDQIKKVASGLTTLSNEKMKEEKAQDGKKKTKAAKTKSSLVAHRDTVYKADTTAYEDDFGDDDFM
ncbi:eukaryotic translation initiation factor 3 subunit J [Lineolata rhizophorae]|uniref:Eukaryotic translation initiation factor 3 subunit J n=1 Tax=Lineolata rhizophorae TaxID=578093 RepID=A0A6A6NML0_9PEZI|nr:eukaryotic translation initiation factor 3 subunit J [Lineolata rhizophorae]